MPRSVGQIDVVYPHENDFACMLGKIFKGPCEAPLPSIVISEASWTIQELKRAIRRLKHDNWRRGWVASGTVEACSARILDASTLYAKWGSLLQAQGQKCETVSYIHQRLQKAKNSGSIEHHKS